MQLKIITDQIKIKAIFGCKRASIFLFMPLFIVSKQFLYNPTILKPMGKNQEYLWLPW